MTREEFESLRDRKWRTRKDLRVTSEEQAVEFIEDVGFCLAFGRLLGPKRDASCPGSGILLPSLWEAVCGVVGGIPAQHPHHDPYIGLVWDWKDTLHLQKRVFYGKVLRGGPLFVSLRMLPFLYALWGDPGPEEGYLTDFEQGTLSRDAKVIYECILELGPLHNTVLRRETNMLGRPRKYRFLKSVAELQRRFRIVKVDVGRERWGTVWDAFFRWMPEVVEQSASVQRREAVREITLKHVDMMIVATPKDVARLFDWPLGDVTGLVDELLAEGLVVANAELGVRAVQPRASSVHTTLSV